MDLPDDIATLLKSQGKNTLILGIRPENITITSEREALFSAPCLVSEPQGSHQIVAIELENKIIKIVTDAQPKITAGETVHLGFNEKTLRFFDKDTGLSIGD